jgi:hypothetical protein
MHPSSVGCSKLHPRPRLVREIDVWNGMTIPIDYFLKKKIGLIPKIGPKKKLNFFYYPVQITGFT